MYVFDRYYDKLSEMTYEECMAWYKRTMYAKPLKYIQEIDNITYIIRTNFTENVKVSVYNTVERLTEKNI